jgi:hypothetical protein
LSPVFCIHKCSPCKKVVQFYNNVVITDHLVIF